jgi:hypothetical protein
MKQAREQGEDFNVFPVLKDGDFSSESPTLQAGT